MRVQPDRTVGIRKEGAAVETDAWGTAGKGNPCRVMRKINEHDKKYYYKDRETQL